MAEAALMQIVAPTLILQQQQQQQRTLEGNYPDDVERLACIRRRIAEVEARIDKKRAELESVGEGARKDKLTNELARLDAEMETLRRAFYDRSIVVETTSYSSTKHRHHHRQQQKPLATKASRAQPNDTPLSADTRLRRPALQVADTLKDEQLRRSVNAIPILALHNGTKAPAAAGASYIDRFNQFVKEAREAVLANDVITSRFEECAELARRERATALDEIAELRRKARQASEKAAVATANRTTLRREQHGLVLRRRALSISVANGRAGADIVQATIDEYNASIDAIDARVVRLDRERDQASRALNALQRDITARSVAQLRRERQILEDCERRLLANLVSEQALIAMLDQLDNELTGAVDEYYSADEEEEEEEEEE